MFVDSGLPPSPCDKSHHKVIYVKLNLKASLPPLYKRRVWDYNEANYNLIKETLSNTNWEAIFENSTPDKAVKDFTNIILSTMSQFIPSKIITINERDTPWLTKSVKTRLNQSIEHTINACHVVADQRKKSIYIVYVMKVIANCEC